jgi:hypothetical protein
VRFYGLHARVNFTWIPQRDFEEQFCVPSEEAEYQKLVGEPAALGKSK